MSRNLREEVKYLAKENKVKDMSMSDKEWQRAQDCGDFLTTAKVNEIKAAFTEEYGADSEELEDALESIKLIRSQVKRGNKSAKNRVKYYDTIKTEGRMFSKNGNGFHEFGWPVQRGQTSKMEAHVQESLTAMEDAALPVFIALWNDNPIIQVTSLISDRNKTAGGSTYDTAEAFAKAKVLALRQRFVKHAIPSEDKDGVTHEPRWDGIFNIEGMTIAPPHVTVTDDATEEVSEGDSN